MSFGSAMQKMQYESITEAITEHNALVAKLNAATGDRDSLAESIRESDDFADVRNKIAELEEQLEAAVNEQVEKALANATEDTTGVKEKIEELKTVANAGLKYYKTLYHDETAEQFPKVDRVKGTRTGGGGGGGRRVRGYDVVVTIDDEVTQYENFASAAKALGVGTSDLQEQFFAKAGVEKLKDAPDSVTFSLSWVDVDEDGNETPNSATVEAVRTGPSGPPETVTAEDTDTEVDTEEL